MDNSENKKEKKEMKKQMKLMLAMLMIVPMTFILAACGQMDADTIITERIPMLTISNGTYEVIEHRVNGVSIVDDSTGLIVEANTIRILDDAGVVQHVFTYTADAFGLVQMVDPLGRNFAESMFGGLGSAVVLYSNGTITMSLAGNAPSVAVIIFQLVS